jgi:hypothetical protein
MPRSRRRPLLTAAAALASLAVCAGSASGQPLMAEAGTCPTENTTQPFLPWLDFAPYRLAPGGSFEDGTGSWSLTGGAQTADDNEPYSVHGGGETTSLELGDGSSATSAPACVAVDSPTLRFFAKRTGGPALGALRVEVVFGDAVGGTHGLPLGSVVDRQSTWDPTAPMLIKANLRTLLPTEHSTVQFRFTPQNGTSWTIDDVYIDPFFR